MERYKKVLLRGNRPWASESGWGRRRQPRGAYGCAGTDPSSGRGSSAPATRPAAAPVPRRSGWALRDAARRRRWRRAGRGSAPRRPLRPKRRGSARNSSRPTRAVRISAGGASRGRPFATAGAMSDCSTTCAGASNCAPVCGEENWKKIDSFITSLLNDMSRWTWCISNGFSLDLIKKP